MSNLSQLNENQQEAVRYMDGPCLVLAGAGSGKTLVITQKIAYMIENKLYEPGNIAALTFTNKAAKEMHQRVNRLLKGTVNLDELTITTFHALGVQILRAEAQALNLKRQFSIFDAGDSFVLIQNLSSTTDKKVILSIQNQISLWKNALITPEYAKKNAEDLEQSYAAKIYQNYEATLAAYQAVDFDDLIRLPVLLFQQNEAIRDKWQRKLRYLLIDEYQDTNLCQYELIKLLVTGLNKKSMFTAVGDDNQAIYAWRGATLENMKSLQKEFSQLKVIQLQQNYRSSNRILEAANAVISKNPVIFEKKLWSNHGLGEAIQMIIAENPKDEAVQVVRRMSMHRVQHQAQFKDYAILYRGNYQAREYETILREKNIPYTISGGQSFFARAEIRDLISYLRLIANLDDDPAFIRAVTTPRRGVGQSTLEALGKWAGQLSVSLFEATYKKGIESVLSPRQLKSLLQFTDFINQIEEAARSPGDSSKGENAALLIDELLKEIHYEQYLYNTFEEKTARAKWQNILEFTKWLKNKCIGDREQGEEEKTLLDVTQLVSLMTRLDDQEKEKNAVHLSTLHAAKGLEYPHVFLVGVEEGILPHINAELSDEQLAVRIEEERRLMYVGITRAMRTLHVSWCKKRDYGRELRDSKCSRFIREMQTKESSAPIKEKKMKPNEYIKLFKNLLSD